MKLKIEKIKDAANFTHVGGKKIIGFFWLGSKKNKQYHIVINITYVPNFWERIRMFIAGYNYTKIK